MAVPVLTSKPSFIEFKHLKFLIMDAPKDNNLHLYLKECEKHHVSDIVRISEPTYSKEEVEKAGISLHVRRKKTGQIHIWSIVCRKCISMMVRAPRKILLRIGLILFKMSLEEEMKMGNVLLYIVLRDLAGNWLFRMQLFSNSMIGHLSLLLLLSLKMG